MVGLMKHAIVCKYLENIVAGWISFLIEVFLKYFVQNRPIPCESVINFSKMNLSSNVIVINPSLFRTTSLTLL